MNLAVNIIRFTVLLLVSIALIYIFLNPPRITNSVKDTTENEVHQTYILEGDTIKINKFGEVIN